MIGTPGVAEPRRKLKVVAFPGPTTDAVSFFRMSAPAAFLREHLGHKVIEIHPGMGLTDEQQTELVMDAEVVWGVQPGGWFEERHRALKETRAALVVECDDDLFAWLEDPASKDAWTKAAESEQAREGASPVTPERVEQFRSWLKGADLVVTTTERLANVFRAEGAKAVRVCPNGLFPAFQRTQPRPSDVVTARGERAARILQRSIKRFELPKDMSGLPPVPTKRVGWTGSIAHKADVAPMLVALRRIAEADAGVEVASLGPVDCRKESEWATWTKPAYRRLLFRVNEQKITTTPFCLQRADGTIEWLYYRALEGIAPDVAVIPMRPSRFNEGKSAVTLHSWAIQGVPCVVSRTGPYADAERDGFPAIYVDHHDADAWAKAVRELLYDRARARELGERAKARVLERHVYPEAAEAWADAFDAAVIAKDRARLVRRFERAEWGESPGGCRP